MLLFLLIAIHPANSVGATASNALPSTVPSFNVTTPTSSGNATVNVTETPIPCIKSCSCYRNRYGFITARCNVNKLPKGWSLPGTFQSLDLSYNELTEVPKKFFKEQDLSNLLYLSLRGNNITIIEEDAFLGLHNLTRLDLSFINLNEWKGEDIASTLPSLKYLDVTGNFPPWIPSMNVLNIKTMIEITGVTWSKYCFNCTLANKIHNTGGEEIGNQTLNSTIIEPPFGPQPTLQTITIIMNNTQVDKTVVVTQGGPPTSQDHMTFDHRIPNMFMGKGFFPNCPHIPFFKRLRCLPARKENNKKKILKLPSQLFYIAYALGSIGIVLNFSIIFIYIYSTNIRKINSMLLISNMAFCDILVGVYAIIIAKYNVFRLLLENDHQMNPKDPVNSSIIYISNLKFCKVASVLFTVGQIVSVITALLLTIDKFLSIVYCMDPNRKLSRRLSLLVLMLCWVGVVVYAFAPEFTDMVYSPVLLCTFPITQMKVFIISVCLLVALYLANIPLYAKIFLFVRRSSVRMGVRRDAALAKKIAVLILTNFVFFAVPMILIIIFSLVFNMHYTLNIDESKFTLIRFIVCYLMPIVCLCLNSCLNPFLCAFRQRQFRREFKKCMRNCILSRFCKAISTIRTDSSVRNTQPTRVEMYKLSHIDSQVSQAM